jgi:hypothetical protein
MSLRPGFQSSLNGYAKVSEVRFREEKTLMDRNTNSRIERAAQGAPEAARAEWLSMLQGLAEQIQKQQQNSQQMIQQMMDTYLQLLNTPGSYLSDQAQQQQEAFQQMTQEVLSTVTQLFNIPLSYAQEGLRSAQFPIEGYDELTVEEVSGRLGGLSAEELRVVRDYEERNKNRDTLLEELDRKIRGG